MANLFTTWATATVDHLEANLTGASGEPFTVIHGRRDGDSKDRYLACVFVAPTAEWPQDVNFLRPVLVVRAWIPKPKIRDGSPPDPSPVEDLMSRVWDVLEGVRTSLMDPAFGYFEVTSVEPDYDDWGVQATLTAYALMTAAR